jgi:hypothetical protein
MGTSRLKELIEKLVEQNDEILSELKNISSHLHNLVTRLEFSPVPRGGEQQ